MTETRALAAIFWAAVAWGAVHPIHPQDYRLEIATPGVSFFLLWATGVFVWTRTHARELEQS
jgi:hypothetical protein